MAVALHFDCFSGLSGDMTLGALLDAGLPRAYNPELYRSKCSALFEHVYESYQGDGDSVYAQVA